MDDPRKKLGQSQPNAPCSNGDASEECVPDVCANCPEFGHCRSATDVFHGDQQYDDDPDGGFLDDPKRIALARENAEISSRFQQAQMEFDTEEAVRRNEQFIMSEFDRILGNP